MMKYNLRILFTLFVMAMALPVAGQIQSGYVRTAGRPDKIEGKRLPGTSIRFRGKHNAVVSDRKGTFLIDFGGSETSYIINSVICDGYELQEKELLGRREPVSESVPKEIVMVSLKEKKKIEDKVRKQVEAKYQNKLEVLQKELDEHKITEEQYKAKMQRLNDEYDLRDQLVHDMVERYAYSDYAKMNAKEIEINTYIENGELEKADSVINSLNIAKLENDRSALLKDIDIKEHQLEAERNSVRSIDSTLWIAYRGKADIFYADFQNDSVAYYLERMLTLDPNNIALMIEVSTLYDFYLANSEKSLFYLKKAKDLLASDSTSVYLTICMNDLGACYTHYGEMDSAFFHLNEGLKLARMQGDKSREALVLSNLYNYYSLVRDRENQKKCIDESMAIYQSLYGNKSEYMISSYSDLAHFHFSEYDYRKVIGYEMKALNVMPVTKDTYRRIFPCYTNLGCAYEYLGMLDSAEYWHNKALKMTKTVFGENHPEVATCYNNLGSLYSSHGKITKALELRKKSLAIYKSFYKDYHRDIAMMLNNLSVMYGYLHQNDSAAAYALEALRIYSVVDSLSPSLITVYSNIGSVLTAYGQLNKALEYFMKADEIAERYPSENRNGVATLYLQIGNLFSTANMSEKALLYYGEALKTLDEIYEKDNFNYFVLLHNMGTLYSENYELEEALKYFNRAERILEDCNLTDSEYELSNAKSFGVAYHKAEKYDIANKYTMKAYRIAVREYGDTSIRMRPLLGDLAENHHQAGKYDSSLVFALKEYEIMTRNSMFDHQDYWGVCTMINTNLHRLGRMDECNKFMEDKSFVVDVIPEGAMASRGYEGRYYLLEWKGWNVTDTMEFFNAYMTPKTPLNVMVYRDGKIYNESFEGKVGANVHMYVIGREKKEEIVKAYQK